MSEDLTRVVDEYVDALADLDDRIAQARAEARAEALEEAAKVARDYNRWDYVQVMPDGSWQPGSPYDRGKQEAANDIATAICALIAKPTDVSGG